MTKRKYIFRVQAYSNFKLPFPDDMLRYDECEIELKYDDGSITLVGSRKPTVDRWESFGWTVLDCKRKQK